MPAKHNYLKNQRNILLDTTRHIGSYIGNVENTKYCKFDRMDLRIGLTYKLISNCDLESLRISLVKMGKHLHIIDGLMSNDMCSLGM